MTRRRLVVLALLLGVLAAPGAAHADEPVTWFIEVDQRGSDNICQPHRTQDEVAPAVRCRTISGALAKTDAAARRTLAGPHGDYPFTLMMRVAPGTYRENVVSTIPMNIRISGQGPGTLIVGNVSFANRWCFRPDQIWRECFSYGVHRALLDQLAIQGNVYAGETSLNMFKVAVVGTVAIRQVASSGEPSGVTESSIVSANSCDAALQAPPASVVGNQRGESLKVSRSVISGTVGIELTSGLAFVDHSVISVAGPTCNRLMGVQARFGTYVNLSNVLITLADPACTGCELGDRRNQRAGIATSEGSVVIAAQTTVGGPFTTGIDAWRDGFAVLDFTAIDGATTSVDTRGGNVRGDGGRIDVRSVHASGPVYSCAPGQSVQCPELENRTTAQGRVQVVRTPLRLNPDWGYFPRGDSVVVDAIPTAAEGVFPSLEDLARHRRPEGGGFDMGAWERPGGAVADRGDRPVIGPDWLGVDLVPGGFGGVIGGVGVPVLPGVVPVEAGTAAGDTAVPVATLPAASGPALIIRMPRTIRQGATLDLQVKTPYRGRLTVRLYGKGGGLVNVARGRTVNRGWRHVRIAIGPNARVGTLRAYVTHDRRGRSQLSIAGFSKIVKRPRG